MLEIMRPLYILVRQALVSSPDSLFDLRMGGE